MLGNEHVSQLRGIAERLRDINQRASERIAATSREPDAIGTAYAALRGEASGADRMAALRTALLADEVAEEHIDAIDALYVRCLLDPSL